MVGGSDAVVLPARNEHAMQAAGQAMLPYLQQHDVPVEVAVLHVQLVVAPTQSAVLGKRGGNRWVSNAEPKHSARLYTPTVRGMPPPHPTNGTQAKPHTLNSTPHITHSTKHAPAP